MRRTVAGLLGGGAIENARHALDDVRRAIAERAELQQAGHRAVAALAPGEAIDLLARQTVGRLAYVARAGVPDVVPVNYVWSSGAVLIRTGPGPKLQAAQRGEVVAFEVDELDEENRTGSSVVVVGKALVVPGPREETGPDPWASGPRRHLVRIVPTRIDGRRIG